MSPNREPTAVSYIWGRGATLTLEISPDRDFDALFGSPEGVAPYLEQAITAWASIPSTDLRLDHAVNTAIDPNGGQDGHHSVFLDAEPGPPYARLWSDWDERSSRFLLVECDISIGSGYADPDLTHRTLESVRDALVGPLVHEVGHCIGLGHGPKLEMTRAGSGAPHDPVMSGGRWSFEETGLLPDDATGASLLRPANDWLRTTGEIAGSVELEGEPLFAARIWALPEGNNALERAVSVFVNERGRFQIEGLEPQGYALWASPPYFHRASYRDVDDSVHGGLVRVGAGTSTEVALFPQPGRQARPRPSE